jgi:hypothetical protein
MLMIPHFLEALKMGSEMAVRLSALSASRALFSRNIPTTDMLETKSAPGPLVRLEGSDKLQNKLN